MTNDEKTAKTATGIRACFTLSGAMSNHQVAIATRFQVFVAVQM
jgi:hypothetical protein